MSNALNCKRVIYFIILVSLWGGYWDQFITKGISSTFHLILVGSAGQKSILEMLIRHETPTSESCCLPNSSTYSARRVVAYSISSLHAKGTYYRRLACIVQYNVSLTYVILHPSAFVCSMQVQKIEKVPFLLSESRSKSHNVIMIRFSDIKEGHNYFDYSLETAIYQL